MKVFFSHGSSLRIIREEINKYIIIISSKKLLLFENRLMLNFILKEVFNFFENKALPTLRKIVLIIYYLEIIFKTSLDTPIENKVMTIFNI